MNNKQQRWVEELATTSKRQGGFLLKEKRKDAEYFCCLGIAREMFGSYKDRKDLNATCLSDELTKEMGLRSPLGELKEPYSLNGIKFFSLAMMNDKNFSFKEIAAYIKRNPENVFQ